MIGPLLGLVRRRSQKLLAQAKERLNKIVGRSDALLADSEEREAEEAEAGRQEVTQLGKRVSSEAVERCQSVRCQEGVLRRVSSGECQQ